MDGSQDKTRPPAVLSSAAQLLGVPFRAVVWLDCVLARQYQNILTALIQIWVNKARAVLTTLGIVIAVTSTITVVSFVEGFGNYVTGMLRGFGTNLMFVVPYRPSGMEGRRLGRVVMDVGDVRAVVSRAEKVRRISPLIFLNAGLEYGREKLDGADLEYRGATEQFQSIRSYAVDKGRFFGPLDVDNGAYVCVLGRDILRRLQCDERIVGDYVYLDGLRFEVLGLLERKGNMMGESQDNLVVMPYTTAMKVSPVTRRFMAFIVEATGEENVDECALQISRILRERHHIQPGQPNDFRIFRQDEFLRDFRRVKIIAASVLAGIVGISLIVGGIGIMNVMLVSVTERTREIGLRKSVGGHRRDILCQFLTEATVLSTLGGLLGILIGFSICRIASLHPSMIPIPVPVWVVFLALAFSASVGVFFGLVPAVKAAIIHPIDALRHE